jgi:hypothetical protein
MMDPASAIGIASAALTFLEFTYKFGNALFSIATDTGPADFDGVEETCRKMREMASDIVTSQSSSAVLSPAQLAVISLSNQCRLLADRILRKLEKTKPATRKFVPAIKAAVKYVCSKNELMVLQQNLDTCRAQLHLHLSSLHAWVLPFLDILFVSPIIFVMPL